MENQNEKYLAGIGLVREEGNPHNLRLYTIKNPDGTVRWIWNAHNPKPDFLRFYAVTSFRSRVFSFCFKLIFLFKLQHLLFKNSSITTNRDVNHLLAPYTSGNFALFTGTEGPNRKLVLHADGQFVKIALNDSSNQLITHEASYLGQFKNGKRLEIPQATPIGNGIISLTDIGLNAKRQNQFSSIHAEALHTLQSQSPVDRHRLKDTRVFQDISSAIQNKTGKSGNQIPVFLREKLERLSNMMAEETLAFTMAHRDFTPWNCYVADEKILLYDFELAHPQLPFGFDALHFVIQQGILVDRLSWRAIQPRAKAAFALFSGMTQFDGEPFEKYLKAYLLINISYHIDLYTKQENWHEQIHWLLNTWNDALSDVLQHDDLQRALVTLDVFDFLQNKKYATVKYPDIHPSKLDEYSDIDLLCTRQTAKQLLKYLSDHSLVTRVNVKTQSHMMRIIVMMHHGQLLAVDLIWRFKRRALEFMNAEACLQAATDNSFGIKTLSTKHIKEYLMYFYHLNMSTIPARYLADFGGENQTTADSFGLRNRVKAMPENSGIPGIINKINYVADTVRHIFQEKGMVITFSGVDGAGKSTIIEKTKQIIEKKLRKNVVVIRHRPSLLPILSAFTHGKAAAEKKAATTLPRQGQNHSLTSSLLRFGYYYADYLVGQFYVYIKHVLRGKVVLYDRYYFDFINDGLRSNIRLPKWITKAGYKLLIPPHLNFFLYADAQTILSRKEELDEKAITDLTSEYLELFAALDAKVADRYFPLENLQIEESLQFISNKAQLKIF